ncbi:acyl carrier protein [Streptomyces sp. NPDC056528]|uniref:acyl carrier protein n=1 Tax=Streptomyces sp. NPDC056528 TaxID=3345854 RepID=UPI0036BF9C49
MDRAQILKHLQEALADVLNKDIPDLAEEMRLFEDLALDSTSVIELLMALEDTVGLEIDPDELEPDVFATVGSLADYVAASMLTEPAN